MRAIFFDGTPVLFPGERAESVMTDAIRLWPSLDRSRFWVGDFDGALPLHGDALVASMAKLEESGLQKVIAASKETRVQFQLWCEACRYPWVSETSAAACPACGGKAEVKGEFEVTDVRRN